MNEDKINSKRIIGWAFLSVVLVVLDQLSKLWIVNNLAQEEKKEIIKGFFSFFYCRNTGVAFSMFDRISNGSVILSCVAACLAVVVMFVLFRVSKYGFPRECFALSLILGGAIGNIIDRIRLSYVVDFIRFDFGAWTFPIFNVADICAVVGCFLFLIYSFALSDEIDSVWKLFAKEKNKEISDIIVSNDGNIDNDTVSENDTVNEFSSNEMNAENEIVYSEEKVSIDEKTEDTGVNTEDEN